MCARREPARRHRGRGLVVFVVAVAALLVGVDRVALVVAQRAAATTIRNSQHLAATPSVRVAGFPFLTQLVAGDFHQITITAKDVPTGSDSRGLTISTVDVVLRQVHVARDLDTVRAKSATASGTLSYHDLSHALGITLSYAGQSDGVGRVQASGSVTVLGQKITSTVAAGVGVSGDSLEFVNPQIDGANLPSAALPLLREIFGAPLPLSALPFGVTVHGVQATAAGITIDLTGADLVYTRS